MTTHLIFAPQQRPFAITPPEGDPHTYYSCNYLCATDGVSLTWIEEVAEKLEDASLGIRSGAGANMFIGLQTTAPTGDGPFIRLIPTSGLAPDQTYKNASVIDYPGLQVMVSGADGSAVRTRALDIYNNLRQSVNVALSPT